MFIGKIEERNKNLIITLLDGEELFLAINGKLIEEDSDDYYLLSHLKNEVSFTGHKIGNVLNIVRRHGPFVVVERVGLAMINMRGVRRGSKDTKVGM